MSQELPNYTVAWNDKQTDCWVSEWNPPKWMTFSDASCEVQNKRTSWPNDSFCVVVDNVQTQDGKMHWWKPAAPVTSLPVKTDLKVTKGKPQLFQLPYDGLVYATRAFEYGESPGKYERGNYLRPTNVDLLADFDRLSEYLGAAQRHIAKATTSMLRARGTTDKSEADLRSGALAPDPESGLPHLCGAITSLLMGVQQAVDAGLLPVDPGRPWENTEKKNTGN